MPAQPTQGSSFDVMSITSLKGEELDIKGGVVSCQYYEDLFSPTITANIQIVSTTDVYNTLPIRGGEKVVLKITTPYEQHTEKTPGEFDVVMYVNKISGFIQEKQMQTFILELVSEQAITNQKTRVLKKYLNKKISEIIDDVLKLLKFEEDDIETVEETQKNINFYGNMRKPFTIIPHLAARAIPVGANSKTAGFLFWQTRKGVTFRSFEEMIKEEKKATYTFSRVNENAAAACRENMDEIVEKNQFKVLQYSVKNNNDVVNDSAAGEKSTYRCFFNPNTFEFVNNKFQANDDQESLGTEENPTPEVQDPNTIPAMSWGKGSFAVYLMLVSLNLRYRKMSIMMN